MRLHHRVLQEKVHHRIAEGYDLIKWIRLSLRRPGLAPQPQYAVGTPPAIEGGEIIATEDLEVDNGLETRKENAAPGSTRMSIMAGDSFDLPHLPGQETTYVGNGGWSTFVPWGLTTPEHVNAVLEHLLGEFTVPRQPTLTREERMARREEQKKGRDKGKNRN
ncbi:hypothetical protein NW765_016303 [Fusarium oxysporum]|nr:hypothetical protein NW765_016303 [Fusarium oxysporum]